MSAKYFCDVCENEIASGEGGRRVKRKLGDVEVEIMSAFKGCWNGGNLCDACIIKVVNKGKPSKGCT